MNFSTLIQFWYRQNHRNLPWRDTNNPYFIWLSEVILQQTRVDQGLAYYLKFIDHYPTVQDLAAASEDAVLNDWQGLGYYSRARNLHAAAKCVVKDFNGVFPSEYQEILSLKGVGEYTAAAISSIAFNLPHAVVDGNVYRVLSRYLNIDEPIDTASGKKIFKEAASELLDDSNPSIHNQAIMELGALVCTPANPKCDSCPVNEQCLGLAAKNHLNLPVKSKKIKVKNRYFHYYLLQKGKAILIKKRPPGDIWQGLYDFPLIESNSDQEPDTKDINQWGLNNVAHLGEFKHILTHQRIFANFWKAEVSVFPEIKNAIEIKINEIDDYPMPKLLIRYLQSSDLFVTD